jgi:hypothetical protein
MIEKIIIKDYNNDLETKDSLNRVKAVDAAGNDILVSPDVVANSGGCGVFKSGNSLGEDKWYRIAIGETGSRISTAIINIGKIYNSNVPTSQLFYVSADGYSDGQTVVMLASNKYKSIGKARIIYKGSQQDRVMLDIYVISKGNNNFYLSYCSNIGFVFQAYEEVSADIPEGYSVKEFTF